MSYEPPLNDPVFYDDSDFIKCKECEEEFDHNLYNSRTCEECENKQTGETK
jgi:Zn finger protein HypA/HybF involved in hydrogenase expression